MNGRFDAGHCEDKMRDQKIAVIDVAAVAIVVLAAECDDDDDDVCERLLRRYHVFIYPQQIIHRATAA